ncbi:cytochrome P450, partial [Mycena floridula]
SWAEYGPVFAVPWTLGTTRIIVTDPKAVAHFYARETYVYVQNSLSRVAIANLFGKGILWAEGDALTPAFSVGTIRKLTTVFYDASYKLEHGWDVLIDAGTDNSTIIEVQQWMNNVALDSVGIGGFSHDFGTLDGKESLIASALESFGKKSGDAPLVSQLMFVFAPVIPLLLELPIGQTKKALISLSQQLDKQDKLKNELALFGATDPTYDQLMSPAELPYLDVVVHEILHLHPPLADTLRDVRAKDCLPNTL